MAYEFYLDDVLLPIAPSKVQTSIKNKNKTVDLANDLEVNILSYAGLTELSFTVLLPAVQYPFASYPNGFQNISYYLGKIKALKNSQKPFLFRCSRDGTVMDELFEREMLVSLEEYQIVEDANEGMDVTVAITLKQYREYGSELLNIVEKSTGNIASLQTKRAAKTNVPKTYTVKKGDCLWNIAKKYLGDGSRYTEIYKLNQEKIKNPNLIYAGQVLTMPS